MLAHQHFTNSGSPDISVNVVTMNSRAIISFNTSSHFHIGTKVGLFHNLSLFFMFALIFKSSSKFSSNLLSFRQVVWKFLEYFLSRQMMKILQFCQRRIFRRYTVVYEFITCNIFKTIAAEFTVP